jgi:hypothetical protein
VFTGEGPGVLVEVMTLLNSWLLPSCVILLVVGRDFDSLSDEPELSKAGIKYGKRETYENFIVDEGSEEGKEKHLMAQSPHLL